MEKDIKKIDIKEFREKGYLQELNRSLLHPLGLALSVKVNDDGSEEIDGIYDYRDVPEGVYYAIEHGDKERKERFKKNEKFIIDELQKRMVPRQNKLGFFIEPIN